MKKYTCFFVIVVFVFICAKLTAQSRSKKERMFQSNMTLAEQQLKQGNRSGAKETYNFVRKKGGTNLCVF